VLLLARGLTEAAVPPLVKLLVQKNLEKAVKGVGFSRVWSGGRRAQTKLIVQLNRWCDGGLPRRPSLRRVHHVLLGHSRHPMAHASIEFLSASYLSSLAFLYEHLWCRLRMVTTRRDFYARTGFDILIVMHGTGTIPGHMCTTRWSRPRLSRHLDDVNTALQHLGKDILYAGRFLFLSLLTGVVGSDRALEGGLELPGKVRNDAMYLVIFARTKQLGFQDILARAAGCGLGGLLGTLMPPAICAITAFPRPFCC
jgi:hypothetical protein